MALRRGVGVALGRAASVVGTGIVVLGATVKVPAGVIGVVVTLSPAVSGERSVTGGRSGRSDVLGRSRTRRTAVPMMPATTTAATSPITRPRPGPLDGAGCGGEVG